MRFLKLVVSFASVPVAATMLAAGPVGMQPASAVSRAAITCSSMSSSPSGPVELSGCNRRHITGGSGTLLSCVPTGICPLTWSTGKGTNITFSQTTPSTNRCPAPLVEIDFTGTVANASGSGTKRFIGKPVAYDVCFAVQINVVLVELVPGTSFTIR
jgi:hypothetical protein